MFFPSASSQASQTLHSHSVAGQTRGSYCITFWLWKSAGPLQVPFPSVSIRNGLKFQSFVPPKPLPSGSVRRAKTNNNNNNKKHFSFFGNIFQILVLRTNKENKSSYKIHFSLSLHIFQIIKKLKLFQILTLITRSINHTHKPILVLLAKGKFSRKHGTRNRELIQNPQK